MSDFHDITDPGEFLPEPSTPWWIWVLVALASLLALALAYCIYKKSRSTKGLTTLLDQARARLEKLRKQSPDLPPHVTATKISLIIRQYLASAFNDPALFETNEEFTLRESALAQLHPDSRAPITQHLTTLSQIKYAPTATTNITQLITDAENIIANIEINVNDPDRDRRRRNVE